MKDPKFNSPMKIIEVRPNNHGLAPIVYNSTTYAGGPECPCSAFVYTITSVESSRDVGDEDQKELMSLFRIDP